MEGENRLSLTLKVLAAICFIGVAGSYAVETYDAWILNDPENTLGWVKTKDEFLLAGVVLRIGSEIAKHR